MNRRTLLKTAGWLTLGYPIGRLAAVQSAPRFSADPFVAGVASGDPTRNSVVLWTRLIPDPNAERDWQRAPVQVDWEIASDEAMKRVVSRGSNAATPDFGHSVHVDATGLDANRWYWYRFKAGSAVSPVGRTKTAPAGATDRIRFAFASCQNFQSGYFTAYQNLVREDLDAIVFLGDYIYETDGMGPRRIAMAESKTLETYRARYAMYRTDPHLREAHRLFPWIITWDDHEVQDNYASDVPKDSQPRNEFIKRRAAAYQAHYEWLPMPKAVIPKGADARMYRTLSFGPLANFIVLDGRQYRSDQPCGDGNKPSSCPGFFEDRTMLGSAQEKWVDAEMRASRAQWNVLANQVAMTIVDQGAAGQADSYHMDAWAGYEAAQRRMTASIGSTRVRNPIVITGDIHSNWVCDLKADYRDAKSPAVATELIGTSISSGGDGADRVANTDALLAKNPQIRFFNNQRGYVRCEVNSKTLTADFRVVEKVSVPESPVSTRATFVVEDGRPGARKG
ncbi:MAG TPA: alkaline phosphatase D family protein [Terriglobia bacterium]|nr:alkaline phosphatase D family protein [Terriglobia bacterium]